MAKKSRPAGGRKGRRGASSGKRGRTGSEERLYPIAPDLGKLRPQSDFITGTRLSGEQGIILYYSPLMYAFWFDREGAYLRQESREISSWSMDKPFEKRVRDRASDLQAWVDELGLTPGTIHVKRFHTGGTPSLSIHDYPIGWDGMDWGEGETLEGMTEWWNGLGAFVLNWNGFEHNIDKDGIRFQ
jgi:hypothetical protein